MAFSFRRPPIAAARRAVAVFLFAFSVLGASRAESSSVDEERVVTTAREQTEPLTLAQAVSQSLRENPEIRILEHELQASEARQGQAGLRPNPEFSVDLENFGGNQPGLASSETTLSLGQLFELGGKRKARTESANAASRVISIDLEAARRVVAAETARRFYDALAAEESLELFEDAARIAEEVKTTVSSKVRVGAVPKTEETRAELELQSALLRRREAEIEAALAKVRLSSLWNEFQPRFNELAGSFESVAPSPPFGELLARLDRSPHYARFLAEVEEKRALVFLARSNRIPDVKLGAGVRRLADEDGVTFVGSISTPLPLFDRGRSQVAEADANVARSEATLERARVDLTLRLAETHSQIERLRQRIETLRTRILPTAEQAFQETKAGYALGRFEYIDLLEARRALAASRREEVLALLEYHIAVADAELLLGDPLNSIDETGQGAP